jgi:hypothetical protein
MTYSRLLRLFSLTLVFSASSASAFDHTHASWSMLLAKYVVVREDGNATAVNYVGFAADRTRLHLYLQQLEGVPAAKFERYSKPEQMAFLINAYNAHTIELVLTRYPKLESIKDLGSLVRSPWKRKFIKLLGRELSLDDIEHSMLREPGTYDEPRVHFAVNCASVGCPMLRNEAYVAARLDQQLDDQTRRFLSDRARNRYDPGANTLQVSAIFSWYGDDFARRNRGFGRLEDVFARYAAALTADPAARKRLEARTVRIEFLEYDWSLNDAARRR